MAENDKIPQWLNILFVCIIISLFFFGAIKSLTIPGTIPVGQAFGNCVPGAILLMAFIIINVFLSYDLATLIVIFSLFGSGIIFYFGIIEKDKDVRAAIVGFASGILGFGVGLPIGKQLSKDNLNQQSGNNLK